MMQNKFSTEVLPAHTKLNGINIKHGLNVAIKRRGEIITGKIGICTTPGMDEGDIYLCSDSDELCGYDYSDKLGFKYTSCLCSHTNYSKQASGTIVYSEDLDITNYPNDLQIISIWEDEEEGDPYFDPVVIEKDGLEYKFYRGYFTVNGTTIQNEDYMKIASNLIY